MTVAIAALAEDGTIVCASDSAINIGGNRITRPTIKGGWVLGDFVMFAGDLCVAQKVMSQGLYVDEVVKSTEFKKKDAAEFLMVRKPRIWTLDTDGSEIDHEDWGAIGHGSDSARMLLEALYKKRSVSYVESTLKTIIGIIQKYDNTVYGPVRTVLV